MIGRPIELLLLQLTQAKASRPRRPPAPATVIVAEIVIVCRDDGLFSKSAQPEISPAMTAVQPP
jgi:hypothetical protein